MITGTLLTYHLNRPRLNLVLKLKKPSIIYQLTSCSSLCYLCDKILEALFNGLSNILSLILDWVWLIEKNKICIIHLVLGNDL